MDKKIRVLIAKTSLDGHWRGVVTVAAAFRNAGMEVIYAGQATAEQILQTALQEDVDVVGLNIGGRFGHVEELIEMLKENGMGDLLVVAGGPLLDEDIPELKRLGVAEVFPSGSRTKDIVAFVQAHAPRR
ncbi:MAG: cobalamin-dependent protein [Proteobacteria bacterium]|nr:cobalamin-dependent protein [Pseudomonadota bacterium]